jgi:hypothetical protein
MGVFKRPGSKFWHLWLELAPKGQQRVKTDLEIGVTKTEQKASRYAAERVYHAAMLYWGRARHGLLPVGSAPPDFKARAAGDRDDERIDGWSAPVNKS